MTAVSLTDTKILNKWSTALYGNAFSSSSKHQMIRTRRETWQHQNSSRRILPPSLWINFHLVIATTDRDQTPRVCALYKHSQCGRCEISAPVKSSEDEVRRVRVTIFSTTVVIVNLNFPQKFFRWYCGINPSNNVNRTRLKLRLSSSITDATFLCRTFRCSVRVSCYFLNERKKERMSVVTILQKANWTFKLKCQLLRRTWPDKQRHIYVGGHKPWNPENLNFQFFLWGWGVA